MKKLKKLYNELILTLAYHGDNIYRILWDYNRAEILMYLDEIKDFKEKYGQCSYTEAEEIIKKDLTK